MTNPQILMAWLIALGASLSLCAKAIPPEAYPYWPEYQKTPLSDIRPQVWRTTEDVIDGWDWSLPLGVKPAANGLLANQRAFTMKRPLDKSIKPLDLPINPTISLWITWRELEPEEGQFKFDTLKERISEADKLGYSVVLRLLCSATKFAPDWISKKGIPIRVEHKASKMKNYEISNPKFHISYIRLVDALAKSGIPKLKALKGAYVGYASPSYGDEGIGPHNQDPDSFPHVIERLDAWARAFQGMEHKVFMGGISEYGLKKGFGIRRGFVEMYLYHIPDEKIGQKLDENGYLYMDESAKLLLKNPFHGEENEEYEEAWVTAERGFRFGRSTDSFSYRYFTSNLRLLQMRCNCVLYNSFSLMPEQQVWVGQSLGRTVADAPDIWCFMRESYVRKQPPVKNFERWLYQRDTDEFKTKPAIQIQHAIKMWMVEKNRNYDYIARSGKRIGLAVDDRWGGDTPHDIAIKVSYFDIGKGAVDLEVQTKTGTVKRSFMLTGSAKLKTATFFFDQVVFAAKQMDHDLIFKAHGDELVLSLVRFVNVKHGLALEN